MVGVQPRFDWCDPAICGSIHMATGWIWIAAGIVALTALYLWYTTIVRRANKVREALGSIDAHLRQRHDLIPNLVKLAGRFMEHERGLIEEVTRLRARVEAVRDDARAAPCRAVRRREPAGAGHRPPPGHRRKLSGAEVGRHGDRGATGLGRGGAQIAARRFYNAAVTDLDNAVQVFPGSILAVLAGARTMPYFVALGQNRLLIDTGYLGRQRQLAHHRGRHGDQLDQPGPVVV